MRSRRNAADEASNPHVIHLRATDSDGEQTDCMMTVTVQLDSDGDAVDIDGLLTLDRLGAEEAGLQAGERLVTSIDREGLEAGALVRATARRDRDD